MKKRSRQLTIRSRCSGFLACWLAFALGHQVLGAPPAEATAAASKFASIAQKPVNFREPRRKYEPAVADGWTIMLEKQLRSEAPELAKKAADRLSGNLAAAIAAFPETARARLKKVRIFLMYGSKADGDGRDSGCEYFQSIAPDHYKNLDPDWGNSIVIYSAENYLWQSDLWALKLATHELAHAYHLGQWPEDKQEICRAYDNAMARKLYRDVSDVDGPMIEKAYAIQNPMEYFAELSCMVFAACDYAPHNRLELEKYDPEGYAMIREMWGIKE